MRQKRIVDQQIMNLQRIRSDLRKQENIDASLSKGDTLSGVKRQVNPIRRRRRRWQKQVILIIPAPTL